MSRVYLKRIQELEKQVEELTQRIILLGIMGDILAVRGIITKEDMDKHINELTEGRKQPTGSKTS